MNLRSKSDLQPDVNLTPLIDVVFLLLIFFMVSTTFERESVIKVTLPESSGEIAEQDAQDLLVTIDSEGRYFLGEQQVVNTELSTLKSALAMQAGDRRDIPVVINADAKTPHEAVVRVMDAAMQLGLIHIQFATRRTESGN